jgi:arginyl-tRNA--protein-N-Asp/Glu arginylyltransferase
MRTRAHRRTAHSEAVCERVSKRLCKRVYKRVSKRVCKRVYKRMSKRACKRLSKRVCKRVSKRVCIACCSVLLAGACSAAQRQLGSLAEQRHSHRALALSQPAPCHGALSADDVRAAMHATRIHI